MLLISWMGFANGQSTNGERIPFSEAIPDTAFYPGMMAVKLKAGLPLIKPPSTYGQWQSGDVRLDALLKKAGIQQVDSMFGLLVRQAVANENGRAIHQMEDWGLHRWQVLRFDASSGVKEVWRLLRSFPAFETVEPIAKIRSTAVPNDPQFGQQWHLDNTGQTGGTAGADIKAVKAWDIETGSPDVLLAVHDAGILFSHPDLQQNAWFGKGFNFVTNSSTLVPVQHATHVAGLMAGVSNNGLGISGIAGGNGNANSGIRMMSLQIIGGTPVQAGAEALSFVYAANNGAAVSQNSWGYSSPNLFPAYTADAIDYFVANGGGNQLKGGIAIFSAGNNNSEELYYPAPYSKVLAVAATAHTDVRASYSSYGSWVDIAAPGGESSAPMLSTILNNGYGTLFGTSMACPLVSGVAGLLVSHLKGRLMADDVRSLLQYAVDDIYPVNMAPFSGKLGTGRLNAFKALLRADSMSKLPVLPPVSNASLAITCQSQQLQWTTNTANTRVLIAYAPASDFIGLPFNKKYFVGEVMPGGGTVVYDGIASSTTLPLPIDGTKGKFRIWTTDETGTNYSVGTDLNSEVPYTIDSVSFGASVNSIAIAWKRQCPNRGLLLAFNENGVFGKPTGDPALISQIAGGGIKLTHGIETSYLHTGLQSDKSFYYAFYAYLFDGVNWVYSQPNIQTATTSCGTVSLPIVESFTSTIFPPANWRIFDNGPNGSIVPDNRSWQRVELAGSVPGDNASALINAYTQNGADSKEGLRTPSFMVPAKADSLIVRFDYAYRAYSNDADLADSLELAWSNDCGLTFQSIWKSGGAALATVNGFSTAEFIPSGPQQWKNMRFNILPMVPAGSNICMLFRATNKFGQNLWLDQVNVQAFVKPTHDAALVKWVSPSIDFLCTKQAAPSIIIGNRGADTLQKMRLQIQLESVLVDSLILTGLQLPPAKDTLIALPAVALKDGANKLTIISGAPNGFTDENRTNDTLFQTLQVSTKENLPVRTSFENNTQLPAAFLGLPFNAGWVVTTTAGYSGNASLMANRFTDTASTGKIELVTPILTPSADADSLLVHFAWASALRNNFGSIASDTLEIWLTKDCGATRQQIVSKSGLQLATNDAPLNVAFTPATKADWQTDILDLTPQLSQVSGGFQLIFGLKKGRGNNTFLDDLNIFTKQVPAALKAEGFAIYPNPFQHSFLIWHLKPAPDWRSATLLDATGKQLRQWKWEGNAPQTLQINGSALPKGLYLLHLQYSGFARTQKLLKW